MQFIFINMARSKMKMAMSIVMEVATILVNLITTMESQKQLRPTGYYVKNFIFTWTDWFGFVASGYKPDTWHPSEFTYMIDLKLALQQNISDIMVTLEISFVQMMDTWDFIFLISIFLSRPGILSQSSVSDQVDRSGPGTKRSMDPCTRQIMNLMWEDEL